MVKNLKNREVTGVSTHSVDDTWLMGRRIPSENIDKAIKNRIQAQREATARAREERKKNEEESRKDEFRPGRFYYGFDFEKEDKK